MQRRAVLVLCLLLLPVIPSALAQSQTEDSRQDRLDLLIGLDISGTMYQSIRIADNRERALDLTTTRMFSGGRTGNTRASDPDNLRYETTEALLAWLSDYVANREALDINVMVLAFDDDVTPLLEWQPLNGTSGDITLERTEGNHSDFRALYEAAESAFAEIGDDNRQAMLIVTDSPPCAPERFTKSNPDICGDARDMTAHIRELPRLTGVSQHMLVLNPVGGSFDQYWEYYTFQNESTQREWQNRLGDRFVELSGGVDELPASMIHTVLAEIAAASGVISADEVMTGQPLTSEQYAELGLAYTSSGNFNVAPYQSYFNALTLFATTDQNAQFTTPANDEDNGSTLFDTQGNRLQITRVSQPAPGEWNGPAETWITFRSAEARVRLSSDNPTQYAPLSFIYELLDAETGEVIAPQDGAYPVIDVTVVTPDGSLSLGTMEAEEDRFVSPSLLPLQAGNQYTLQLEITAGNTRLWRDVESTAYLEPNTLPSIDVQAVGFNTDFVIQSPAREAAASSTLAGDRTITMPRSLRLDITMQAETDGREIPLPEGISAELLFTSPDGEDNANACPTDEPVPLNIDETREQAATQIGFATAGECNLEVRVTLESTVAPLESRAQILGNIPRMARSVTVTDTARLTFFLIDQQGTVIEEANAAETEDEPHYEIEDRQANPPEYPPNSLTLRVELRDENGDPLADWPDFLSGAQRADAEICTGPAAVNAETTPEPGAPQIAPGQQRIVPFSLRILNTSEEDVAVERGVCWYASDNPGVYLAVISGFPPDDYTVQAVLDRSETPLDFEAFEYAPSLFDGPSDQIATRSLSMRIRANPAIQQQIGLAVGIIAGVVAVGTGWSIRRRQNTVAPLRGGIAIARVSPEQLKTFEAGESDAPRLLEEVEFLWRKEWPNRNNQTFHATDFVSPGVARLKIITLEANTRREDIASRSGSFYIRMQIANSGNPMGDRLLSKNEARLITSDQTGAYYVVNIHPDRGMTVRELLQSVGGSAKHE